MSGEGPKSIDFLERRKFMHDQLTSIGGEVRSSRVNVLLDEIANAQTMADLDRIQKKLTRTK